MGNREDTTDRILNAALKILATEGFSALGINPIARRAEADKQLIYRYFGGLEGLLQALGRKVAGRLTAALEGGELPTAPPSDTPTGALPTGVAQALPTATDAKMTTGALPTATASAFPASGADATGAALPGSPALPSEGSENASGQGKDDAPNHALPQAPAASYAALMEHLLIALYRFMVADAQYRQLRLMEVAAPSAATEAFKAARGLAIRDWLRLRAAGLMPPAGRDIFALNAALVAAVEGLAVLGGAGLTGPEVQARQEAALRVLVRGAMG